MATEEQIDDFFDELFKNDEFAYWKRKANRGNIKAYFKLGELYDENNLYEKSFYWYKKAALKGCVDSMKMVGKSYKKQYGVDQDYNKAFYWYKKAALKGDSYAQYYLGYAYEYGVGVKKNFDKANFWYNKSQIWNK